MSLIDGVAEYQLKQSEGLIASARACLHRLALGMVLLLAVVKRPRLRPGIDLSFYRRLMGVS